MKKRRGRAGQGLSRKSRTLTLPRIERFEDRLLMATFLVTNLQDNPTTGSANDGTLRGAIMASNASTPGTNLIQFSFTTTGVQKISLAALLPAITAPVIIDGSTSNGFTSSPLVQIDGSNPTVGAGPGLSITAAGAEMKDLDITGFTGDGIDLNGGSDLVDGCYIGVNPAGAAIAANTGVGVFVTSTNNTIGGAASGLNVISGNGTGIQLQGTLATGNTIIHNYVGTDATGLKALPNNSFGIQDQAASNTIGGVSTNGPAGLGNLVSGNVAGGISVSTLASKTLVEGNYVGTDLTGAAPLGNGFVGVYVNSVMNTTIGGTVGSGTGNVISANKGYGVQVSGLTTSVIRIQGNNIGVGFNGLAQLGNVGTGVLINGSSNVTVGGSTLLGNTGQFGNIIAYNGLTTSQYGVEVMNAAMDGILSNSIYGNGNLGIKLNQGNAGVAAPTITSAQSGGGQTKITGSYAGSPNTSYRIQLFSSQTANPSGAGDGQNYLGDLDFTTNNTGSYTFTTVLLTSVPVGNIISATATQQVLVVNNTSQFANDVTVTKAAISDLGVATAVPSIGPLLDENYTYTVTVTNFGPDPATGVVLTDTIPTNSTFISSTAGAFASGVVTDTIGALAANATATLMITVKPISTTGKFTNTATVKGTQLDVNPTNDTSITTGVVQPDADLSVNLVPSTTLTPVGSPLIYTLVVGNNGPSTANNVVTTLQLPADFTSIVVSTDQGNYTVGTDNLVTINTGTVPSFSTSTIIITATPTNAEVASATAKVTTIPLEADPNPANNQITVPVTVAQAADLGLTISAAPASGGTTALVGQPLLYTIDVTNNGPSQATSPVVVDQLPAGVTYDTTLPSSGIQSVTEANGTLTINLFPLVPGATEVISFGVTPSISTQLVNSATVSNVIEIDPDSANNTASVTTLISPADLQVTIDRPSSSAILSIGTNVVYQVTVSNFGPATANNVILNDSFNSGATIVSSSVGQPTGGSLNNVNLGDLASGSTVTVLLTVDPTFAGYTGKLIDSASVSSDEIDPNPTNNNFSSSNLVNPVDVGVVVSSSPASVLIGQTLTYVVAVTNYGPATATNVNFTDTLPAGVIFDSVTTTNGTIAPSTTSANTLTGDLLSLAPNSTALITIIVTSNTVGTATNFATATPFEFDTNTANNSGSASSTIVNFPGSLQLASTLVSVPENGGSVTLTVDRTGGTLGAVTVDYATTNGTAIAGVNYVATSGTLTFAAGQTTATITIPVLDDGVVNGDHQFLVILSNPTNGASIGSPSTATVDVTNTDRDTVPPVVSSIIANTNKSGIIGFTITFDKAMDSARASFLGNYHLFLNNGSTSQTPIGLASAVYNPANDTVTLTPTGVLPNNRFYRVLVNATVGFVLTDTSGNILSGSNGPRSNYDVSFGQGTSLTFTDAQNNSVNLSLTGGGIMQVFRGSNGDANTINLIGIVPHKSKLTGSVKKLKKSSSGHTYIGSITGFGQFGNVRSSLTTPAFYVGSAPVGGSTISAASVSIPDPAVAVESIPTHHVTVAKKTPKGPKHPKK